MFLKRRRNRNSVKLARLQRRAAEGHRPSVIAMLHFWQRAEPGGQWERYYMRRINELRSDLDKLLARPKTVRAFGDSRSR